MSKKAFFLDRDGVVIRQISYLHDPALVELEKNVPQAIRKIHENGMLAVVLTNQSGVARGMFTEKDVDGEYHDTNIYNIKRNSMYLGSSFWYDYTLKGTTNQDIQVTLLMQGTDYIVLVYYQNGNNIEIEEF